MEQGVSQRVFFVTYIHDLQFRFKMRFKRVLPRGGPILVFSRAHRRPIAAILCTGGPDVIRKKVWSFYRTISGVLLCWELDNRKGHEGPTAGRWGVLSGPPRPLPGKNATQGLLEVKDTPRHRTLR